MSNSKRRIKRALQSTNTTAENGPQRKITAKDISLDLLTTTYLFAFFVFSSKSRQIANLWRAIGELFDSYVHKYTRAARQETLLPQRGQRVRRANNNSNKNTIKNQAELICDENVS